MSREGRRVLLLRELNSLRGHLLALGRTVENINGLADPDTIRRAMDQHPDGFDRRTMKANIRRVLEILNYKTTVDRREKHPDNPRERKRFLTYKEMGFSLRYIADDTGLPLATVQRKMDRYTEKEKAIQVKPRKESNKGKRRWFT